MFLLANLKLVTHNPFNLRSFRINLFIVIGSSFVLGCGKTFYKDGIYDFQLKTSWGHPLLRVNKNDYRDNRSCLRAP